MKVRIPLQCASGFTLVEMLVVIAIIAILAGITSAAYSSAITAAYNAKARIDLQQIVLAVDNYYTEYGKYPLPSASQGTDVTFGENTPYTSQLMDVLRANGQGWDDPTGTENLNPRRIVFATWAVAKDPVHPKSGIGADGNPYDPWGRRYIVTIDGSYDNFVANPYGSNAGGNPIQAGVIAWSFGKDSQGGTGDKNAGTSKDDLISWQ